MGALLSMFTGFMLLMGGWIAHWVIEYRQAKAYAASVCGVWRAETFAKSPQNPLNSHQVI